MERTDYNEPRRRRKAGVEWPELQQCFVLPRRLFFRGLDFESGAHLYHWRKFSYPGASRATLSFAETVRHAPSPARAAALASLDVEHASADAETRKTIIDALQCGVERDPNWLDYRAATAALVVALKCGQHRRFHNALLQSPPDVPLLRDDYDDDAECELFRRELVALRARLEPSRRAPPLLVGTKRKTLD